MVPTDRAPQTSALRTTALCILAEFALQLVMPLARDGMPGQLLLKFSEFILLKRCIISPCLHALTSTQHVVHSACTGGRCQSKKYKERHIRREESMLRWGYICILILGIYRPTFACRQETLRLQHRMFIS